MEFQMMEFNILLGARCRHWLINYFKVKLVKCVVNDITIDISFNQLSGPCALCFLEQVDCLIGKNHLFKCSIILIKSWCYYESHIMGAMYGLLSTYALETLVLYIFRMYNASLASPLMGPSWRASGRGHVPRLLVHPLNWGYGPTFEAGSSLGFTSNSPAPQSSQGHGQSSAPSQVPRRERRLVFGSFGRVSMNSSLPLMDENEFPRLSG